MRRAEVAFPAMLVVLLSLPCVGFTFLWDDYHFLNNELTANLRDWLPRMDDPFYRPISRALYFSIVGPFGMSGALLAHLMNLVYVAFATAALGWLAFRLRGAATALTAGTLFAGMAAMPALVGWASCGQDLLSIDFVLLALLARWHRRDGLALLATAAALLSKETALSVIPALVAFDWILKREPYRWRRHLAAYGTLVVAWAAIHPAVRVLFSRGFRPGATGYVGLTGPDTWAPFVGKYATVLANLRLGRFDPTWPSHTTVYLALVAVAAAWGFWSLAGRRSTDARGGAPGARAGRVMGLGLLLCLPPLLMTSTIINSWAPYYAAFPMLGFALIAATALERSRTVARAALVGFYLVLGIWARGSDLDALHVTERMLRPSSDAMRRIERGFRTVQPEFPPNADIVVSVQARGVPRVYAQMYLYQPLRVWYRDASLRVWKPIRFQSTGRREYLFVVTPDLDVVRLDPSTFAFRTASGSLPDYSACEKALRGYGLGLAASGSVDEGAGVLLHIPNLTPEDRSVHQRTAAMLLLAARRVEAGDSLIATAEAMPRELALANLEAILAEQPPGQVYDQHALRAFGIAVDDEKALRELATWLVQFGYAEPARRFASRLLSLRPGDPEGLRVQAQADSILEEMRKQPIPF